MTLNAMVEVTRTLILSTTNRFARSRKNGPLPFTTLSRPLSSHSHKRKPLLGHCRFSLLHLFVALLCRSRCLFLFLCVVVCCRHVILFSCASLSSVCDSGGGSCFNVECRRSGVSCADDSRILFRTVSFIMRQSCIAYS